MNELFIFNYDLNNYSLINDSLMLMSEEKKKLEHIKSKKRIYEYTLSRSLLRFLLKKHYHFKNDLKIQYTPSGKPFINDTLHFNWSHTADYIILGFSDTSPVGVDIESKNTKNYLNIAQKYFSKTEFDQINQIQDKLDSLNFFLQLWALKESYFKAADLEASKKSTQIYFDFNKKKVQHLPKSADSLFYSSLYGNAALSFCTLNGSCNQKLTVYEIRKKLKTFDLKELKLQFNLLQV